mmetsp:Transcript_58639/g.139615  ORF Transcript_58639/g.139615 Transcript_58639/m.139615 type:complete len:302 (+) Transcript_58639:902-1807(+)
MTVLHLGQIHLLRVFHPGLEEGRHVLLVGATPEVGDLLDDVRQLHKCHPLLMSVALVHKGHVVPAAAIFGHAPDGANHVPQHCALVLAGAGNGHRDVPQVRGELWIIAPEVGVGRKHARAKHDRLHAEADQEHIAEEPHRSRLVLLVAHVAYQGLRVDVAVRAAVGQGPLLGLTGVGAAPRDRHAAVIEGRGCSLLSWLEPRKARFVVEGAVHSASHQVQGALASIAPIWIDLQMVLLVQLHGMRTDWILHRWELLIEAVILCHLDQGLVVLTHRDWRVSHAVVMFVQLGPGASFAMGGLE